jgi:hypothetical protein
MKIGPKKKMHISTKQNAYQNIYFTLRSYFIQNKYVSHTINSPLQRTNTPRGAPHSLETSGLNALCVM